MKKTKLSPDKQELFCSYTEHVTAKALEKKLAEKESIISQADTCIFESVFTDSLGKPSDNAAMLRKLEWLAKAGQHNMEGIMDFIKNNIKNYDTNGRNEKVE